MKRLLFIALGIICYHVVTFAQEVKVEVRGIRSAKGAIMVMAQQDSESKPVYAMATAVKDTVTVVLKDVPWEKFLISLFHDENGNWELDMNEQGIPVEGYAREKCKKEADEIAKEFLELMDKDAEAFEPLSRAYGLPKSTPEEIAEVIAPQFAETDLDTVTAIVKRYYDQDTWKSNLIFEVFAAKGSRIALSDAGVGATLLKSAMQGASLNVYINTKSMKDRKRAEELNQLADSLREEYEAKADRIFAEVSSRIR